MPPAIGAVHAMVAPLPVMVPPVAVHTMELSDPPAMVAVKFCTTPAPTVGVAGSIDSVTGVTVTFEVALLDGSATLVAVTV